jgi:hypothetical protein
LAMTGSRISLYIQRIFRNINDGQRSEIVLLQMTISDVFVVSSTTYVICL